MSVVVDFTQIAAWENGDRVQACMRLSSSPEDVQCHPEALEVIIHIFKMDLDSHKLAQFCVNCEILGLRGWKVYFAYKQYCNKNYLTFVQAVLQLDEEMMHAVRKEQK